MGRIGVASGKCGFTALRNRSYQHFDIKPIKPFNGNENLDFSSLSRRIRV
jgi:hypothetical protein